MSWADSREAARSLSEATKKALSDYFTPAELIELLDIDTETLIEALERETEVFTQETVTELKEIIQLGDDE